jgi:hypothetical protein
LGGGSGPFEINVVLKYVSIALHLSLCQRHCAFTAVIDDDGPPEKPKGMRWRTYDRLAARLDYYNDAFAAGWMTSVSRLLRGCHPP